MANIERLNYYSMQDVISILDTATLEGGELVREYGAMQTANRALIAHHAIEKGFKARLDKEGITYSTKGQHGHDLYGLYQLTKQIDNGNWAMNLADAFKDAVTFYEYDLALAPHLETLDSYLLEVGVGASFVKMRYWLENQITASQSADETLQVSLLLHREILAALWPLAAFDQQRLVSRRVEGAVWGELRKLLPYSPGTPGEQSHKLLIRWLRSQPDARTALRETVQRNYLIEEIDEQGRQNLRKAFERLSSSDRQPFDRTPPLSADPAVRFYIAACRDIRLGLQLLLPDAEVRVKWLNNQGTVAEMSTPAGEALGLITKHVQSRWLVEPHWEIRSSFSKSLEDAKHWLINLYCRQVSVVVDGSERLAYIFTTDSSLPQSGATSAYAANLSDVIEALGKPEELELNFWHENHKLRSGQQVAIALEHHEDSELVQRIEGVVDRVERGKVWIVGHSYWGIVR